jgi:hypothetical protein
LHRPMTTRIGIELSTVGTPIDIAGQWPAIISPDQSAAVVEIYRGDVRSDTNKYGLLLFARSGAGEWRWKRNLVTILSRDLMNVPGLARPTWRADSRSLRALVADEKGVDQVTRIGLLGDQHSLTASRTGIVDYAFDTRERTLAYLEGRPRALLSGHPATYSGLLVENQSVYALLQGRQEQLDHRGYGGGLRLKLRANGRSTTVRLPADEWPIASAGLSVSPSGRYVVIPVTMARRDTPIGWRGLALNDGWVWISGFRLLDRQTGLLSWLVQSPTYGGTDESISWSRDDRKALVTGVVGKNPDGSIGERAVLVDVASSTIQASFPGSFGVERPGISLEDARLVKDVDPTKSLAVIERGGLWGLEPRYDHEHLIELAQDLDHKPVLDDLDRTNNRRTEILDLNPDLDEHDLNPVHEYQWSSDGRKLRCGLYVPANFEPGRRYPLVIQTHGWSSQQFWYDGPSTAGFAAQALASAGFLVAQVDGMPGVSSTANEEAANATMFDDLIDALDKDGLVDAKRVGITGWSRTGIAVRYALAFGRHKYAAAILADSSSGGYFDYLMSPPQVQLDYDRILGAEPFGRGLSEWEQRSPMFNFDRIVTPIRVMSFGSKILFQYENLAVAHRLGKPLELVWLPEANHWPIHPSERMEAQQGAVDWYKYWLMGESDATPAGQTEAGRWAALRTPSAAR